VSRVGLEAREAAILDHCDRATSRNAERAIGVKALRREEIGHVVLLPVGGLVL
jgi:hypothetical protein